MKTAEEYLTRGKGNFINCTDYGDAVEAMKSYAEQAIQEVLKRAEDNLPLSAADAKKAVRNTEYKDLLK